jgi:hypothetical protein
MSADLQSPPEGFGKTDSLKKGRSLCDRLRPTFEFTWAKHPELPRGIKPGVALNYGVAERSFLVNSAQRSQAKMRQEVRP